MKKIAKFTGMISLGFLVGTANAEMGDVAAGINLGTLGLGADVTFGINEQLNGRGIIRGYSISVDGEEDGIDYQGDFELSSLGGLLDYHPWTNGFRLSGGIILNNNEVNMKATSLESVEIGDVNYQIDGQLKSNVSFNSIAPYLGVGWGNPIRSGSQFSFAFDLGILFQGEPEADISTRGTATNLDTNTTFDIADIDSDAAAELQAEIAKEEKNLNDDLSDYTIYPVVSVGMSYRF